MTLSYIDSNKLCQGYSGVKLAVDDLGKEWIVRNTLDEEWAYKLATRFGMDIVPVTIMVDPATSAQEYINFTTAHNLGDDLYSLARTDEGLTGIAHMFLLDVIFGNTDRHGNNWGFSPCGKLVAIDTTLSSEEVSSSLAYMKPAFRCSLVDDPLFTPALFKKIKEKVRDISSDILGFDKILKDPIVKAWENLTLGVRSENGLLVV